MSEKILYRISIRGRVQGVGYRWSAVREAGILGITGYVKNMPDGSVYAEAEGTRDQLRQFVGWCNEGPGTGSVDSVTVIEAAPEGYPDFTVRR